jgi:putative ABC transport system permease protein
MLLKRPGFTAIVVVVLALGIGTNTALFSVVNAVLLRPVPWKDPERIVNIWETNLKSGENRALVSAVNFLEWREQSDLFEHVAGWRFLYLNLTGRGEAERIQGLTVSPDYFTLLGVKAALGRTFIAEEEQPGHDKVVVLSHGLWQRRFGSDPNLVGRQITIDSDPYTVVGVLSSDFRTFKVLNRELEVYIPLLLDRTQLGRSSGTAENMTGPRRDAQQVMFVYARLKRGVSVEQAQAVMDTIYSRFAENYPKSNGSVGVRVVPLERQWGEQLRPTLLMLLGSDAFVLLIACANAANLLLAPASVRQKEMTIRAAVPLMVNLSLLFRL